MDAKLAIAGRWRRIGLALAGLACAVLLASIVLNEIAVQGEGGGVGHEGSIALAFAALLAFVTALSIWAHRVVERAGIGWPVAVAVLSAGAAVFGALAAAVAPVFASVSACFADATSQTGVRAEIAAVATPGPCGGYQVPPSDFPLFHPAAWAALAAAGLVLLAAAAMILGRRPRLRVEQRASADLI